MISSIPWRQRALQRLAAERFDLLVVGGGITGAGIARDAALRGLRTALVERDDFAAGTSSRSSRLIHGGVRYLEHGHLHLVFESSRERRILLGIAPHLVRPLAFTWPVYAGARVPRWKLRAALVLYDALALFRNVRNHASLDASGIGAREPALRRDGLQGGAVYHDAATDDTRLTLANAIAAAEAGAVVLNHATVRSIAHDSGTPRRAVIAPDDAHCGTLTIAATVIVNATGPWTDELRSPGEQGRAPSLRGTKGAHILVPRARIGNRGALTLLSPVDGRVMFVLPSGEHAIVGTTDTPTDAPPGEVRASREDVDYLIAAANHFFPDARLGDADVISAWAGIRPLVAAGYRADPSSASREHTITRDSSGLVTVTGGKLTTYRAMAAEVVDEVQRALGRRPTKPATATIPLPGGNLADLDAETAAATATVADEVTAGRLVRAHGARWRRVWSLAERDPSLRRPISAGLPYIAAEIVHAITEEMACSLADLLVRRTHVAFETPDHGIEAARAMAPLVARTLGWSDGERSARLDELARDVRRLFAVE